LILQPLRFDIGGMVAPTNPRQAVISDAHVKVHFADRTHAFPRRQSYFLLWHLGGEVHESFAQQVITAEELLAELQSVSRSWCWIGWRLPELRCSLAMASTPSANNNVITAMIFFMGLSFSRIENGF